MIEERSKDYSNAKRVAREFEMQNKGILRGIPSVPPLNSAEELKQVSITQLKLKVNSEAYELAVR